MSLIEICWENIYWKYKIRKKDEKKKNKKYKFKNSRASSNKGGKRNSLGREITPFLHEVPRTMCVQVEAEPIAEEVRHLLLLQHQWHCINA